jgi:hypothetical protein
VYVEAMYRSTAVLAASASVLLVLAGCSASVDQGKMKSGIEGYLESAGVDATLEDEPCDDATDLKAGDTFECVATVDGQELHLEATMTDDDGNVSIINKDAVLDMGVMVDYVTSTVLENAGVTLTDVDCGDRTTLVQAPGSSFDCAVTADDGATATVVVTVEDIDGTVSSEIIPD